MDWLPGTDPQWKLPGGIRAMAIHDKTLLASRNWTTIGEISIVSLNIYCMQSCPCRQVLVLLRLLQLQRLVVVVVVATPIP